MQPIPVIKTLSDIDGIRYHVRLADHTMPRAAILAALTLVLSTVAYTTAQNDPFDRLFAQTLARRQSIASLRARFTETTTSSLLLKPIVAHGTVVAAPRPEDIHRSGAAHCVDR
jgi:hypothetical protein